MSGYQYPATAREEKAADLLRSKGWRVSEPTCPLCHGWGTIPDFVTWTSPETAAVVSGTLSSKPCPNGCSGANWYYTVTGTTLTATTTTAITESLS